jgi:hypothetical protein
MYENVKYSKGASFTAVGNSAYMYGGMGSELYDSVLMLEQADTAKHSESKYISREIYMVHSEMHW